MINFFTLYSKLQPYRVKTEEDLAWDYRSYGGGRTTHDDWVIGKNTKRIDTAYKVPYPFKKNKGNQEPRPIPVQEGYPLVPGTHVFLKDYFDGHNTVNIPHIMAYDPVPPVGEWGEFAAFLNDEWVPCFLTSKFKLPFGKVGFYYGGLKADITHGDWMAWFPEISGGFR